MTPSIETAKDLRQADEDERRDDVYKPVELDHNERALEIAEDLAAAGAEWVTRCEDLRPLAARIARLEGAFRATMTAAGHSCSHPPTRQDAAAVLLAAAGALGPYIPFASNVAGTAAAERLSRVCPCTEIDHTKRKD